MRREAPRDKCPGTFAPIANVFCFPCLLIDNGIKFVVCVCVCVWLQHKQERVTASIQLFDRQSVRLECRLLARTLDTLKTVPLTPTSLITLLYGIFKTFITGGSSHRSLGDTGHRAGGSEPCAPPPPQKKNTRKYDRSWHVLKWKENCSFFIACKLVLNRCSMRIALEPDFLNFW